MNWITELINETDSVPHALLVLSLCAALGAAIGNMKIRGVQLGAAGVLFSGLLFGHFGVTLNHNVLEFVRELGLALFVYMVGLSVGPGFFSSLRSNGLRLNSLAVSIVVLGALTTVAISYIANVDIAAMVGVLCGATTNTPALGAATQVLVDAHGAKSEITQLPGLGYAVTYPLGVIGIIASMLVVKFFTRGDIKLEAEKYDKEHATPALRGASVRVINPNLEGVKLEEVASLMQGKVNIARIQHEGVVSPATASSILHQGDIVHGVGTEEALKQFKILIGCEADINLTEVSSPVEMQTFVVTNSKVVDKTIGEIGFSSLLQVVVTRVTRGEVELLANPGLSLRFGDLLRVVGEESHMSKVEELVGNSKKKLHSPDLLPVFIGLSLGVLLGAMPIPLPGISQPLKLGMAAGPLIVALIVSRLGQIGGLISYFPTSANAGLREFGILLFIACVGLRAGGKFVNTLVSGDGVSWMCYGVIITMLPIITVGLYARLVLKMNLLTVWGVCAGSTTDPPALAFAGRAAPSNASAVGYATVYPLVMLLRVVIAQLIILGAS